MNLSNSNDERGVWAQNIAFVKEGMPIRPDANPQEVVQNITKDFCSLYDGLIAPGAIDMLTVGGFSQSPWKVRQRLAPCQSDKETPIHGFNA